VTAPGDAPVPVGCSVCAALPDRVERAAKVIPELWPRLAVLSREPTEWRTFLECQVCGTVWIEDYELTGHGERPVLERHRGEIVQPTPDGPSEERSVHTCDACAAQPDVLRPGYL
jgi:hypothetical protein